MRIALAHLASVSPYQQSRKVQSVKVRDETHDEFEERTWREKAHCDSAGNCFIPPMAFKNCLAEAARYKSIQIPGKGKSTYTKHFEAGVLCVEPVPLGCKLDDVRKLTLYVPPDGKRGSGKRVTKHFPVFDAWAGKVQFLVLDEIINDEVFEMHLIDAGQFIGIGAFRPRNNGYFGRFKVEKIEFATRK